MHTRAYMSGYLFKGAGDVQSRSTFNYDPKTSQYVEHKEEIPQRTTDAALEMRRNKEESQAMRDSYAEGADPQLAREKDWRRWFAILRKDNPNIELPNKAETEARRTHRKTLADFMKTQTLGIDIPGSVERRAPPAAAAAPKKPFVTWNGPTVADVTDLIKNWVGKARGLAKPDAAEIVQGE